MSTCGEVCSDVHALIEELTIRRVEHRSEIQSNGPRHLAERTKVARLQRRFSFVLQQARSFRTRHHPCRQGVALAGTRKLRSQGPMSVHTHCTEGVTGSEGREGTKGVGVEGGNGNGGGGGTGDVNGDGDRAETGTERERERERGCTVLHSNIIPHRSIWLHERGCVGTIAVKHSEQNKHVRVCNICDEVR